MSRVRTRTLTVLATIGVAATPVGVAWADGGPTTGPPAPAAPAPAPVPVDAQAFVNQATQSNTFEIVSSQLALQRSRKPIVRRIAEHLIRDHTQAQQQLAAVAAQLGLQVPGPNLNPQQQALVDQLRGLHGQAFAKAYLKAQVVAHQQAIALFVGFASNDANPRPLRLLAIQTLPILGGHLGEVRIALERTGGHHH